MLKNVKIISDDYYYIRGLQSLFHGKRYLNVTCYHLYDLTRGGLIDIFLTNGAGRSYRGDIAMTIVFLALIVVLNG